MAGLGPKLVAERLSVKPLPCLSKSHKFPKQIVLNSWSDTVGGWIHTFAESTEYFCCLPYVDTDHKFKQDQSDKDECVNSGPDTGQILSCLVSFFFTRKM